MVNWNKIVLGLGVLTGGKLIIVRMITILPNFCIFRIPGLILIHAWNPNDMNTLTSDHVKCHFVRPDHRPGVDREEVLEVETLYRYTDQSQLSIYVTDQSQFSIYITDQTNHNSVFICFSIREFGELSEGETHVLCNNNPIHFNNGTAMMLTLDTQCLLDCGVICGQVYDGLDTVTRCPHHR